MTKKKILITGKGSYIGTSFKKWLDQWPKEFEVEELSVRGSLWKEHDFSIYDVVLHLAGIAHVSTDPKMEEQYYKVNRDLTYDVAVKAKTEGVRQFIFMSSIIVYGDSSREMRIINQDTIPTPSNFYGRSKLEAEKRINTLLSDSFKIVILRPPMIYGKGSKGNYTKLAKLAQITPIFPDFENVRSMLHIDNLCEFIKILIETMECGLFTPQNKDYVKTSELVRMIALAHDKNIKFVKIFNPIIKYLSIKNMWINKLFGNLIYDKSMSSYNANYQIRNFQETIVLTEMEN